MSKKNLKRKIHKIQTDSKKDLLEQEAYIHELQKRIYHLETVSMLLTPKEEKIWRCMSMV